MITIKTSDEIYLSCPNFAGAAIFASVQNSAYNEDLWNTINSFSEAYKTSHNIEDIKKNKTIEATRNAYKKFGKDPNRYRPSSEALCRRILRDLPLYQIDTLVDLINLVSIQTGYSIGGFDADKIIGNTLILGIGKSNEPYEGIGRGMLNIDGLPVYRDSIGGIGTPTSDNERTKIDLSTTHFLAIVNAYNGKEGLNETVQSFIELLKKYAYAQNIEHYYF